MGVNLQITAIICAPLERVYALSVDIDRASEWLPADVKTEKLTEGPIRVGTRYRETRPILGRSDTGVYEVTILDPPKRSEVFTDGTRGSAGRGLFRFRLEYEPVTENSTRVTLSGSVTGLGCLGVIAAPLVRRIMRRNMVADLAGLKAWIERQR